MVVHTDVIRAPPEAVWDVLVDVAARGRWHPLIVEATSEQGGPGEAGSIALYKSKRANWCEIVLDAVGPETLTLEWRDSPTGRSRATLEWRLAPIRMGTHVMLEVAGRSLGDRIVFRYVKARWFRRLLDALKIACEGPAPSLVGPDRAAAPSEATPAPSPPDGPSATARPPPRRRAPGKKRAKA